MLISYAPNIILCTPLRTVFRYYTLIHIMQVIVIAFGIESGWSLNNSITSDGSILSRNDLERHIFSKIHVEALKTNSLIQQGAISQHDHPVLGQPFFYVHPCDTSALMAQLQIGDTLSYVISWLSFFGPPVGLYIDPIYMHKD